MLLNPPINLIREKADSRYTLVVLAAKRARDLIEGKPKLADTDNIVPISIASEEIADDLITWKRHAKASDDEDI
ncbi:MAG: DNA-directed RNA polymerase subunit omega [Clostridiales Family XIII bacterium]|jgi:DNA-directed RNA polymerase subunit omega|nr:DNA-directed RNA polymerase subunit omega [Clostridiales Family XIII bacterium]